jgi:GT2 family glycosyltransferase
VIYILLPAYNRREITRRFVECLVRQTYNNYHLILLDDGSIDGTEEMVRERVKNLTVIKGRGDWWWAGSLQQGYNMLKSQEVRFSDVVLIINDDTEFDADFLETAITLLDGRPRTLLLARCYNRETMKLEAGVCLNWHRLKIEHAETPDRVNCLATRGLFLHLSDFLEIGGFYPRLLPHYLSDYEFTHRAFKMGMKLTTDTKLELWMDEKSTGYRNFEDDHFTIFLKRYFSKRSASNPLYWSSFIALACPWPWKIIWWLMIWKDAVFNMVKSIINTITNVRLLIE